MTAAVVTGCRSDRRSSGFVAKLRNDEDGIGLVELLIALIVLNVGIFATLAAFTSGALALRRASHISTATAIGDKYMECFRDTAYASIQWPMTSGNCTATSVVGPDGRTYTVSATVTSGSQLTTGTYKGSSSVKVVVLTVKGPSPSTATLVTNSSTFSRCNQYGLGTDTNPCQS